MVGAVQIDAPERDLARHLDKGHGAGVRQTERAQAGGRCAGERLGARRVPEAALRAPATEDGHYPALDRGGFLKRDQLLADRPRESLERLRLSADAEPGV